MPASTPLPPPAEGWRALAADVGDVVRHPVFQYLAATAAALVLLFARAPVAGVLPELFAEDGAWTSSLHTRGFWETVFHGRRGADYPVFGNVLLLWLGGQWCAWVHDGDLLHLAGACARVSYLAFAAAISLPVLLLRRQLPGIRLPAVWLLACFLPLGLHDRSPSGFEILGRAANGGFLCLFIAFVLAWHRLANVRGRMAALATDLGLVACAATNPLCHAILPVTMWPSLAHARDHHRPWPLPPDRLVPGGVVAAVVMLVAVGLPAPQAKRLPVTAPPLSTEAAIEIGVARSMLYPVVWPVYRHLSTERTLLLVVVVLVTGWSVSLPRHRPVYVGGLLVMALASLALVLFRPELGQCLGGYRTTFPDRYFYAQHLVALPLLVLLAADATERLRDRAAWRVLPGALVAALGFVAIVREPIWIVPTNPGSGAGRSAFAVRMAEAVRQRRFVDADLRADPAGEFLEVPNPEGRPKRLVVPRAAALRSVESMQRMASRPQAAGSEPPSRR
jgi:hypothetical protein